MESFVCLVHELSNQYDDSKVYVEAAFDELLRKSFPVSVTGNVRLPRFLSLC